MKLADSALCTGCGACKVICSKDAIEFRDDAAGFPSPFIQTEKCIDCGACERACPVLHPPKTEPLKVAYAAQLKDAEALKKSTSGGLFTAFSREIFRRGGVVYGCVWDENCHAVIARAENETEILPMRGSKYVWSAAYPMFKQVKADLDAGRYVLYVGNPCQIAGLKGYLRKEYENLILLDFLCSGAPSPLALDKYLDTFCPTDQRKDLNLKFRDKEPYGLGVHITYNGQKRLPPKAGQHLTDPYYYSFYTRLIDRESCYACPYGTAARCSDLTMGDYWGIAQFHKEFDIGKGVSALTVNSEKGEAFLASVADALQLVPTKPEQIAAQNNFSVTEPKKVRRPENRDAFFETLKAEGWQPAERKFLRTPYRKKQLVKYSGPVQLATSVLRRIRRLVGGR